MVAVFLGGFSHVLHRVVAEWDCNNATTVCTNPTNNVQFSHVCSSTQTPTILDDTQSTGNASVRIKLSMDLNANGCLENEQRAAGDVLCTSRRQRDVHTCESRMPYHSDITNVVNQTSHGERKLQSNDTVLTTPLPRTHNQGRTQHLVCLRNMVFQTRNKFICTMPDQCEHV